MRLRAEGCAARCGSREKREATSTRRAAPRRRLSSPFACPSLPPPLRRSRRLRRSTWSRLSWSGAEVRVAARLGGISRRFRFVRPHGRCERDEAARCASGRQSDDERSTAARAALSHCSPEQRWHARRCCARQRVRDAVTADRCVFVRWGADRMEQPAWRVLAFSTKRKTIATTPNTFKLHVNMVVDAVVKGCESRRKNDCERNGH